MTYRVIFSVLARADARRNARWFNDQRSRAAADRWYAGLVKSLKTLERFPESHPTAEEDAERFGLPIREMLYGRRPNVFRILFTVDTEAGTVTVISLRHASRGPTET